MHPAIASGAIPIIVLASSSARSISRPGGTTSSTSPIRNASAAPIISPVRSSFNALDRPTNRGNRCVPPYPGINPSFTSGCPNFAVSLASRIVQAIASSHPPPSANPLIQAITGFPQVSIVRRTSCPRRDFASPVATSSRAISLMSAPAANAFSPVPVSKITRTATSFVIAMNACSSSLNTFAFNACNTSGRFSVTRPIRSFTSHDSVS